MCGGLTGTIRLGRGGTANLAVLGGNLPPSWGPHRAKQLITIGRTKRGRRVARHNGPVARSTRTRTFYWNSVFTPGTNAAPMPSPGHQ
jgi:hypothetical protein